MTGNMRRALIAWKRANGKNNQQIADDLGITRQAVQYHTEQLAKESTDSIEQLLSIAKNLLV